MIKKKKVKITSAHVDTHTQIVSSLNKHRKSFSVECPIRDINLFQSYIDMRYFIGERNYLPLYS